MVNAGKCSVVGILVDAVDYEAALCRIFDAAKEGRSLTVSALAVHGVMTGALDAEHKFRLNKFDLLVPDGQPVRWALNWLHNAQLTDRVYGPTLMHRVCSRATDEELSIYLYGGTAEILSSLVSSLRRMYPRIRIAGAESSRFRRLSSEERTDVLDRIGKSGASILFCGLGCPRQEIFAFECRDGLSMPILAVGAAFPFLAGLLPQSPTWLQNVGLEWLFRLAHEPRRLWRRYIFLNPTYLLLAALQLLRLIRFGTEGVRPVREQRFG